MILRPEVESGLQKLAGKNPFAKLALDAGSLTLGKRYRSGVLTDHKIDPNRLMRSKTALDRVVEGLSELILGSRVNPDVIGGFSAFGHNVGHRVANNLDLPFINITKCYRADKANLRVPETHHELLANIQTLVVVRGVERLDHAPLPLSELGHEHDISIHQVVFWAAHNKFDLPGHFKGHPKPLIQHSLPQFVTHSGS